MPNRTTVGVDGSGAAGTTADRAAREADHARPPVAVVAHD